MSNTNREQPKPIPNDSTPIWDLVKADIDERNRIGIERYGMPLQSHNGRDMLVDLYQELLDAVCYARAVIAERDDHARAAQDIQNELVRLRGMNRALTEMVLLQSGYQIESSEK